MCPPKGSYGFGKYWIIWCNVFFINPNIKWIIIAFPLTAFLFNIQQPSAYEVCNCMRTPLHTPKTLDTCKESMPCLIKKASRCAADSTSKTTKVPYLSLSVKQKDFICYFIDSVVKIVLSKAATGGVLYKKMFLKFAKFTGKHLCQSLLFNKFASPADVFTYRLNLKIFEHSL